MTLAGEGCNFETVDCICKICNLCSWIFNYRILDEEREASEVRRKRALPFNSLAVLDSARRVICRLVKHSFRPSPLSACLFFLFTSMQLEED